MNYEQWLAALCIWREARGESEEACNAIWWVINNRMLDGRRRWPRTIAGVILQREQFSSFNAGDPNAVKFPIPSWEGSPSPDFQVFTNIAETVVAVPVIGSDPTKGANCYESLPDGARRPAWATPEAMTCQIGSIRFYKI